MIWCKLDASTGPGQVPQEVPLQLQVLPLAALLALPAPRQVLLAVPRQVVPTQEGRTQQGLAPVKGWVEGWFKKD